MSNSQDTQLETQAQPIATQAHHDQGGIVDSSLATTVIVDLSQVSWYTGTPISPLRAPSDPSLPAAALLGESSVAHMDG